MSLGSRLLGVEAFKRGLAKVEEQVREKAAAGDSEFAVAVREYDFPLRGGRLSIVVQRVAEQLESQGATVLGVQQDDWGGVAWLRLRVTGDYPSAP